MTNGTADFVKHKFDMLLLVLVVSIMLSALCYAEHWHDANLIVWGTNTISGLVGALINLLTNRGTGADRVTDASKLEEPIKNGGTK